MGALHASHVRGRVGLLLLTCAVPLASAAPADDIKALVDQGQSRQAYALGQNHPAELGKPAFDYWFGMAAIDAGQPGAGVLALERYLLSNPGSVSARLELGRGYFLLGDNQRAREMFADVQRLSPPADVLAKIERFLAAIREKEAEYRTSITGYIEAGGGRDSNVNGGLAQDTIVLPFFGSVQLTEDGREKSDTFLSIAGGFTVNQPITPRWSVFGGLNFDQRTHGDARQFDQRSSGGAAGVALKEGQSQYRASLSSSELDVEDDKYRTVQAATVEWNRSFEGQRGLSFYFQRANLKYEGDNAVRDARLWALGANWRQPLPGAWQPFLSAGVNVGRESNDRDRDDLGRSLYGARLGVGFTLTQRINAAVSLTWQESSYKEFDPFFAAKRKDRYGAVELALGYQFTPNMGGRLEVSRTDNNSNVVLFDYQRDLVALKLRYDFK